MDMSEVAVFVRTSLNLVNFCSYEWGIEDFIAENINFTLFSFFLPTVFLKWLETVSKINVLKHENNSNLIAYGEV